MKKFFALIAVAAMAFAAQAAEVTVANGSTSGAYAPIYGYNFDLEQHNQMQYPASELIDLAAGSQITAMKFYTGTPELVNALGGEVKVALGNMEVIRPWTLDAWGSVTGDLLDVEVTTVAASVTPSADDDGVWAITFDVPFTYTGGALLIDIETVATGDWKNTEFYGSEMGAYLAMSSYGYAGSKKGQDLLPKVTFTYEAGGEEPGITTLAQANVLEDDAEFTFGGDAVVTVCKDGYVFLRDESGYGMIAGVNATFENGQVLSEGWTATKTTIVEPWVKYTNAANLTASGVSNSALAAAQKLTEAPDETMLNAYVYIENALPSSGGMPMLPQHYFTLPDNSKLYVTDYLWASSWDANGNYNVYGVLCKEGGKVKIDIIGFEPYEEPQPQGLRGDVNNDGSVSIADVTALIDYLLYHDASVINIDNADCNLDEGISIADVTALIDYLLYKTWD
jgi:uncharacterized protein YdeI (BOF family)